MQINNTKVLGTSENDILVASELIRSGAVVAFPTETVYGIGASIFDEQAVDAIYRIKNRGYEKPLSAHISDISMVQMVSDIVPDLFYELAHYFLPGPLTMIIKSKPIVPSVVTSGSGTIAIRFPSNSVCKRFIDAVEHPIAATSANIAGNKSATNLEEVKSELDGQIAAIIDDGDCVLKQESTVISLIGKPQIVRVGALSINEIEGRMGITLINKVQDR